jgi:hypothetical protein
VSRCAPVRPTHLLASLPDDPVDALPEVLVSAEPEPEEPEAPIEGELDEDEPMPDAPVLLEPDEPDDCAIATPDSASSAAAVAAVRVFNIMRGLLRRVNEDAARLSMQGAFLTFEE